ncbi:uncharacterized protein LODBEIA_P04570 [Lodderomyces beijingensis]|uniref:Hcy-binding domain-containing protein n=1 Tax=Lodderomyces beijingensis TaxID=1775926 RepID=A0ABP0ZDI3_9ASCO
MSSSDVFPKKSGVVVIDGALGTELEKLIEPSAPYLPSKSPLWSGQVLIDAPQLVKQVHQNYIEAGADLILTSTYQASYASLKKHTKLTDEQIHDVWQRSIDVVKEAKADSRKTDAIIAGSVGPYAAYLANGSEYTGDYGNVTDDELVAFHKPLVGFFLKNNAVDVIIFETIPNFQEFRVVTRLMKELQSSRKPYFRSITCQNSDNLTDGTPLSTVRDYADTNRGVGERKVLGINCVDYTLVPGIMDKFTGFGFYVYPNLGFQYDADAHQFIAKEGRSETSWKEFVQALSANPDVVGIGGCCNTGVQEIKDIADVLKK